MIGEGYMTINEMKEKKKEKGYSYAKIAELSGVFAGSASIASGVYRRFFLGKQRVRDMILLQHWNRFLMNS